jgi:hypothetical protein
MKDIRTFENGMDSDTSPNTLAAGDYITGSGINSGTSLVGGISNMLGSTLIPYTLPTGNNTCIGTLRNIQDNSIIYSLYNDQENHSILEYFCETKTIEPILEPRPLIGFTTSFLGFTLNSKIHSANILDDIYLWTDGNVSPRKINVKRAKDFLNQLTPSAVNTPYSNLIATGTDAEKLQFIEAIKYKPEFQPSISLEFDPNRKTNYLREHMVQVKYRYIYDDNEKSRWSDGSYISLPIGVENINGTFSNSIANNYLAVVLNTGHSTVKSIDVAFRFGNLGVWGKIDAPIRKYNNDNQQLISDFTSYTYNFYNDGVLIEIPDDVDNYDSIPLVTDTQELIDGNRLIYGNNTEGYQNPDLDVVASYQNTQIDFGQGDYYGGRYYILFIPDNLHLFVGEDGAGIGLRGNIVCIPNNNTFFVVGTVISFTLRTTIGGSYDNYYQINYIVSEDDINNYPATLAANLSAAIAATANPVYLVTDVLTVPSVGPFTFIYTENPTTPTELTYIYDMAVLPPTQKEMTFKKGAWHTLGIIYRDKQGRDGGVLTDSTMNVYNPYLPEIRPQVDVDNQYATKSALRYAISHQPPIWAYEYEIVYALNNLRKYTQFVIKGVNTQVDGNGNYSINCDYIVDYITNERVITSVDFQFEAGDYLRFISNADKNVQEYVETKVLAFDTTTNILTVSPYTSAQITAGMTTPTQEGVLCELFAYKTQTSLQNRPYFAIGETYLVKDPYTANRGHIGNVQDQNFNSSVPAVVLLDRGDCYIYRRYFNNNAIEAMIESENFSDIYASKNIDISSVYAVIPEGKTKQYDTGLRYGGRYFPNTETNNLLQFDGIDSTTLDSRYGGINKMLTIGYTLKVLQTKKNTSIYINRRQTFNAKGETELILTDEVIGNVNPSELDYGCVHPESVVLDNRQMYFFDVNTGSFIQDSANGMYAISEYKAETYFKTISDQIKNNPNVYVYCGMDNRNGYLNVSFVDTNTTPIIDNQTIVYFSKHNRWKSMMPYSTEYFGSNALVFINFKDGQLWEHNSLTAPRMNFFGEQYSMSIKFVSNINYPKVKIFNAIAINTNKTFSSPNIGDIQIPSSVTYPTGMTSRLLESKFTWKEGVSYSDYIRDSQTPNIATPELALLEGRHLRGEVLIQQIENSDTDEVILYSVIVHSTDSEMSG